MVVLVAVNRLEYINPINQVKVTLLKVAPIFVKGHGTHANSPLPLSSFLSLLPPPSFRSLPLSPPLTNHSRMEPSSNQVKEAVHTNAVEKWREKLPARLKKDIYKECGMLKELGYPP